MVVEVDGLLDQPHAEQVETEVQVGLGLVNRGGHMVQAENRVRHGSILAPALARSSRPPGETRRRAVTLSPMRHVCLALALAAHAAAAAAQSPEPFWPGAQYDPKIPTLRAGGRPRVGRRGDDARAGGDLPARARARPRRTARGSSSTPGPGKGVRCGCSSSAAPERIARSIR